MVKRLSHQHPRASSKYFHQMVKRTLSKVYRVLSCLRMSSALAQCSLSRPKAHGALSLRIGCPRCAMPAPRLLIRAWLRLSVRSHWKPQMRCCTDAFIFIRHVQDGVPGDTTGLGDNGTFEVRWWFLPLFTAASNAGTIWHNNKYGFIPDKAMFSKTSLSHI